MAIKRKEVRNGKVRVGTTRKGGGSGRDGEIKTLRSSGKNRDGGGISVIASSITTFSCVFPLFIPSIDNLLIEPITYYNS